jgi:hypothetical protein
MVGCCRRDFYFRAALVDVGHNLTGMPATKRLRSALHLSYREDSTYFSWWQQWSIAACRSGLAPRFEPRGSYQVPSNITLLLHACLGQLSSVSQVKHALTDSARHHANMAVLAHRLHRWALPTRAAPPTTKTEQLRYRMASCKSSKQRRGKALSAPARNRSLRGNACYSPQAPDAHTE